MSLEIFLVSLEVTVYSDQIIRNLQLSSSQKLLRVTYILLALKIMFIALANFSTFVRILWWVLELEVMILKSSAKGVLIIEVLSFRW